MVPEYHLAGTYPLTNIAVNDPERPIFHEPALNELLRHAVGRLYRKAGVTSGYDPAKNLGHAAVVAVVGYDNDGNVFAYVPEGYIRTPADPYIFAEFEGLDP